ncbi:MAG TPA: twin-arginine translocase subunit TatC [Micromonosporaceae bacterium]
MTLIEHIRELRKRLFRACLGIVAGAIAGYFVADRVKKIIQAPYCDFAQSRTGASTCGFVVGSPLDDFMLTLKVALIIGLVISAPVWLYQLWAFIAPGLHKHERRYTYAFSVVAAPLFGAGVVLGFVLVSRSLHWFLGLSDVTLTVDLLGYFDFVTGVMMLFGLGFEFPLVVAMLNFAGLVSAKRLLGWWRAAVFLMFLFAALVTPTPDPFNMTILAVCMSALYFAAVGVAFLNDRRRGRRSQYAGLADDEASSIDPVSPVDGPNWGSSYSENENR